MGKKREIDTLKAGDETIAIQLAKMYTKCITERFILGPTLFILYINDICNECILCWR